MLLNTLDKTLQSAHLKYKRTHQMPQNSTKILKFSRGGGGRGGAGGGMPWTPLARLHENDLQDFFLHESVEKAGVFSCNFRICSEMLWI